MREEEIRLELLNCQREMEEYEDSYREFKNEMGNQYDSYDLKIHEMDSQQEFVYEMKDRELFHLFEDNKSILNHVQGVQNELLQTMDEDFRNYRYQYEAKDDELRRELNRLGWV